MAMVVAPPKKHLLLLFLSLSLFALLLLFWETTSSDVEIGTSVDVPSFTFLIKVLSFNCLHSLSRCLQPLAAADYSPVGADGRDHLHVYIDHIPLTRNDTEVEDYLRILQEILDFVDRFVWRFGGKFPNANLSYLSFADHRDIPNSDVTGM